MRLLFSQRIPDFRRVLLVESGSRELFDSFVPKLLENFGTTLEQLDLVTCYAGTPRDFPVDKGRVFRVSEYNGPEGRDRLYAELAETRYNVIGIICAEQPIMTKWKWMLTWRVPAKLFILNENGDWFFADYSNWRIMLHFALVRGGLSGGDAVTTLARLALFPFTLLFLLSYCAAVHLRRKVRT